MPAIPKFRDPRGLYAVMVLRVAMISRLWKYRHLASAVGLSEIATRKVVGGINRCPRSRAKIENALGVAAWCDEAEFRERQARAQFFGVDIATLTVSQLCGVCKKHGVHFAHLPRPALIENLIVHHSSCTQSVTSSSPLPKLVYDENET